MKGKKALESKKFTICLQKIKSLHKYDRKDFRIEWNEKSAYTVTGTQLY